MNARAKTTRSGLRLAVLVCAAGLLTACATVTPYQPLTNGYGYQDQQLENNRYRVSFVGNSETPRSTVEDYLLYRAARITLDDGYDYFVMYRRKTERSTHYVTTYAGPPAFYYYPLFYDPLFATGSSYPVNRYHAYATIVLHHGKKPPDDIHAYDARQVVQHLKPEIRQNSSSK